MNCPVCKNNVLQNQRLTENLQAKTCSKCNGKWIQSYQYWKWLDSHGPRLAEKPVEQALNLPVDDSSAGKLCPECGHFLTRREIGHGVEFCLDRCNSCGGIWFDKNEWEVLESRNLHDEVHFVFSAAWQKKLLDEKQQQDHENRIKSTLGENDYDKLRDTAKWISQNAHMDMILSYITDCCRMNKE